MNSEIKSIYPEPNANDGQTPSFFNQQELTALVLPAMLCAGLAYGDGMFDAASAVIAIFTALLISSLLNQFRNALDGNSSVINTAMALTGLIGCLWALYTTNPTIAFYFCLYCLVSVITMKLETISWLFKPLNYLRLLATGPFFIGAIYKIQTHELNYAILMCGLPFSLFAIADIGAQKHEKGEMQSVSFSIAGYLTPIIIFLFIQDHAEILAASFLLLVASWPLSKTSTPYEGERKKNRQNLFILSVLYMIIFAAGWNWPIISWYLKHAGYIPGTTLLKSFKF
ncbi:MAG: hypothetical protein HQL26_05025 [Candidatus Omnitrophica bacterium]|nr:hypothetical protein [Candidatus Omnitrophota bacterium]